MVYSLLSTKKQRKQRNQYKINTTKSFWDYRKAFDMEC